ncbi:PTS mannose transporter subunit IID [Salmonella enterica subsp. enterica]|uniref:PTS mannose transporter subunit IID n=1 Tax=Salmonella enterica I TaxID=59201 RepID=A0A3S4HVJ3_SALET|nr:PTS mannose transporter subunit IID [Salmonella enterica subsp. enterica]
MVRHALPTVQTILDQLMPGLVPLLLTFACMWLLRKKVKPAVDYRGLLRHWYRRLLRRTAGPVRLLYTTGAKRPPFFISLEDK